MVSEKIFENFNDEGVDVDGRVEASYVNFPIV